jgi:hypothetical protein
VQLDQPLDLGVYRRWTLFPDFIWYRRASDFERFDPWPPAVASETRFVPIDPDFPVVARGEEGGF